MKRTIVFAVALACAALAQAQSAKEIEKAAFKRDSVADVLTDYRANYARENEEQRKRIAPTILTLERELMLLQAEYERVVEVVSARDAKVALAEFDKAQQQPQKSSNSSDNTEKVKETKNGYMPDVARLRRNLVANDYFVERLSEADYKGLCDAQQRELKVKSAVENQTKRYGELLALQRQYMEAPTREEADRLTKLFNAKLAQIAECDNEIISMWSTLYYNKMYAYDLLMEREGNTSMLDVSAEATSRAEREINDNSDLYQSNALVAYYARKKALTEYELQLASMLSLTTSRDSLKVVAAELKNRDYRLSKLSLQRRSFINYEEIEVKTPTIYNSKNPVPQTKVYDFGTIYRIRIGLFSKRPNISALRGVMPLSYTTAYNNGMYAYFVGGFQTEQEAKEGVAYLKKLGFKEPIIAVWIDGEYYPTLEDMRRSQSQYNLEISGVATLTDEMKAKILSHNSDCTISRIGTNFVVGTFDGKSAAEAVATDLKGLNSDIKVEITKKP